MFGVDAQIGTQCSLILFNFPKHPGTYVSYLEAEHKYYPQGKKVFVSKKQFCSLTKDYLLFFFFFFQNQHLIINF